MITSEKNYWHIQRKDYFCLLTVSEFSCILMWLIGAKCATKGRDGTKDRGRSKQLLLCINRCQWLNEKNLLNSRALQTVWRSP